MIRVFLWGNKRNRGPFTFKGVKSYKFCNGFLCLKLKRGSYICYNLRYVEHFEVED